MSGVIVNTATMRCRGAIGWSGYPCPHQHRKYRRAEACARRLERLLTPESRGPRA